jgi:hypothetical protein
MTESRRVFNIVRQNLKDILVADISIETLEDKGFDISDSELELIDKQQQYIKSLITKNDELLKELNIISVEVAGIKDMESFEYEQSLNRLRELSERAKLYSKE